MAEMIIFTESRVDSYAPLARRTRTEYGRAPDYAAACARRDGLDPYPRSQASIAFADHYDAERERDQARGASRHYEWKAAA